MSGTQQDRGSRDEYYGRIGFGSKVVTVSTLITSLVAIAALLFTGLSLQQTREQTSLTESGQITDRFNAAVTNLGSNAETIRIGGVYALQRIMQDSPRDQSAAIQVLAAFIRQEAPFESTTPPLKVGGFEGILAIDVQTALSVLGTRNPADDGGARIQLENTDLAGGILTGANLVDADLSSATLQDADLTSANFTGADLAGANLGSATLTNARFTGAILTGAYFTGTTYCEGTKPRYPQEGYFCSGPIP